MADDSTQSALECVVDADSFIAFLDALRSDWDRAKTIETAAPTAPYTAMRGWENTTIGSFLEAAVAGGTDNRDAWETTAGTAPNAWRVAAEIILLGKTYE